MLILTAQIDKLPGEKVFIQRMVRAIQKAIEEDVVEFRRENHMETMNSLRYVRGDKINENLRVLVSDIVDYITLFPFQRYSWDGRMIIDWKNKVTYTITTKQNYEAIPKKKNRTYPHFLQTVLAVENKDLKGEYVQETMFSMSQFDDETYEEDYNKIFGGVLSSNSDFHHYVITYEFSKYDLISVDLILPDRDFNSIREISLSEFIKPNLVALTETQLNENESTNNLVTSTKSLVELKSGIRPELIIQKEEERA